MASSVSATAKIRAPIGMGAQLFLRHDLETLVEERV